jgi:hypothetical protein
MNFPFPPANFFLGCVGETTGGIMSSPGAAEPEVAPVSAGDAFLMSVLISSVTTGEDVGV